MAIARPLAPPYPTRPELYRKPYRNLARKVAALLAPVRRSSIYRREQFTAYTRYRWTAMNGKRVGLYLRVSTDEQTIENQRQALMAACEARGWRIVEEF